MKRSHQAAGRAVFAALVAIVSVALTASTAMAEGTLVAEPEEVDFGPVDHGATQTRTVTITNAGPDPVTLAGLELEENVISGAEGEWAFDVVGGSCFDTEVLAVDADCALDVEYAPFGEVHEGLLVIEGGLEGERALVHLHGTGQVPDVLRATPAIFDFGKLALLPFARSPASKLIWRSPVTIQNTGQQAVELGVEQVTGPFAVGSSTCWAPLPPGGSCAVRLAVLTTGLAVGRNAGTLTVPATGALPLTVPLTAEVVRPQPVVPPGPVAPKPASDPKMTSALRRALAPMARLVRGGPKRALRLARFDVGAQGILHLRVRARAGKRWVRIAGTTTTVASDGGERVVFRLNRAGRRILARRKPVVVESRLRFHDTTANAIYTETVKAKVKPKPTPKRKLKRKKIRR